MFKLTNLSKQYGTEYALQNVTATIGKGLSFIVGASGSGKTTLLKILCGMEQNFDGEALYLGRDISSFTDNEKSALYNGVFGFVWQDFHLLDDATVLENVTLPQYLNDQNKTDADKILSQLKLSDLKEQKVKDLSGGQKQRVAIARELMKNPQVIFCDEPTSALDSKNAKLIMDILRALAKKRTVIVVTHDTSLIEANDNVYEFDKGELINAPSNISENKAALKELKAPLFSSKSTFGVAKMNIKNKISRFAISALTLIVAGTLLLTSVSGAVTNSAKNEFNKLVETYGEGILDIGLVGSFMNASGGDNDKPDGTVNQDLNGLYEKYQNDERVEFIVSMQPFENIDVTLDGASYSIEKTGNSPVLTKLVSGAVPSGEEFSAVLPLKFVESTGMSADEILGKKIDFSATIYQWIDNAPVEKPVRLTATVCGVADNTVVYDYEGKQYSFTVDDSFFFNKAAIEELRRQAEITDNSANFTIRAKTPEALISLKDELNRSGIVPLGRFELLEDIVRLDSQTAEQSGAASIVIGTLAVILTVAVFAMTAFLQKREYAVFKINGYTSSHILKISYAETVFSAATAAALFIIASPLLNLAVKAMFGASILSFGKLLLGALLIAAVAAVSALSAVPFVKTAQVSDILKGGDGK